LFRDEEEEEDDGWELPTTKRHFLSLFLRQLLPDNCGKYPQGGSEIAMSNCSRQLTCSVLHKPNCVIRVVLVLLSVMFPKRKPLR
jgi:hypothetical protein